MFSKQTCNIYQIKIRQITNLERNSGLLSNILIISLATYSYYFLLEWFKGISNGNKNNTNFDRTLHG